MTDILLRFGSDFVYYGAQKFATANFSRHTIHNDFPGYLMAKETYYRLTCYKDYLCTLPPCVFNGSEGPKTCEKPLDVSVTNKKDDEPAATFRIEKGKRHELPLPGVGWYEGTVKKDVYFQQPGFCRWSMHPQGQTSATYKCVIAKIDREDEAKLSKMGPTHPKIWRMINPYLDNETHFNLQDRTFRELAIDLMKEGWNEQKMFPYFLIEASDVACSRECRSTPIFSSTINPPQSLQVKGFTTEYRTCDPGWGGYDNYLEDDGIKNDRGCFWNTLLVTIPQTPFSPGMTDKLGVLEIGCGAAVSAVPLVEYLRRYRVPDSIHFERRVQYTGIDVDEESIEKAKTFNPSNFTFINGDAGHFMDAEPARAFDVILFRHPGPMLDSDFSVGEPQVWEVLMRKAYEHLSQQGVLIVSALTCEECLFSLRLFRDEIGATIYAVGGNPLSKTTGRDGFLLMVGKTPLVSQGF